ncbi:unnamed protein product, partial [Staurois parvus]
LRSAPPLPIKDWHLWRGGSKYPEFDRYPPLLADHWPRRSEAEGVLPPCSLLEHVTGPRRLQDHS